MQTGIPYSHAKTSAARYSNYLIILLGILTAFGPLVTDMYLPTSLHDSLFRHFVVDGTDGPHREHGGLALGQLLSTLGSSSAGGRCSSSPAAVRRFHSDLHLLAHDIRIRGHAFKA
ncbi:MAG: hypothetical protein ACLUZZ_05660 [Alistipes inops]